MSENGFSETRVSTGIPGLDQILNGGLPTGHSFLLEGHPGSGKTTVGLQFLLEGARRGERVMYVTLSETKRELTEVAKSHGWSLDDVSIFEYMPDEGILRPEDQYSAFLPSELEFQDTTTSILNEVERLDPHRLVFDSLSEIRMLAQDSLRYRRQVLAMKHYFAKRNCTVLLLDDRTGDNEDRRLESVTHGVIVMEKVPREYGIIRRRLSVSKLRGSPYAEGYHDYTIRTGGIVVFPRLIPAPMLYSSGDGLLSSGLPELDELWGDGIARGTSTLLIGPAGSGKSSLAINYAVAAAKRGEVASCFMFEEPLQTLLIRSRGLGLDLPQYMDKGLLTIDTLQPAEVAPGELIHRVEMSVLQRNARIVVIDSLNGMLSAMPGEQHLALQVHELLSFLAQHGVSTFLVLAQSGVLGSSMHSPIDLSYLADNVLLLRFFEAAGRVRKAVSVVKKRSGEHENTIRELRMRAGRIEVGQPLVEFNGILSGIPSYSGSASNLAE